MKKVYPDFKGQKVEDIFNTLSKANQKIINDYLTYCKAEAKETTIQKYFNKIVQIAYSIEKPLDSLSVKDINNFLALLNLSDRGTDTRNDIKKTLKRFLKWKYDDWNIRFKGLKNMRQKKKKSSEKLGKKDLLTYEELEAILRGAESLRYKAMIMLMFESACRPEECLKLKWKDVDFQNKEVLLNSSKTGEERPVLLDKSILHLKRYFQEYPFPDVKDDDLIFPNDKRDCSISNQAVNDYLRKLSLRTIKKKLYPYIFRHTRLHEIRPKLSVEAYEKIAGHSMEVALEHYGHMENEEAREEMLSKVYNIEELTETEKKEIEELKKEIIKLKKQNEKDKELKKVLAVSQIELNNHLAEQTDDEKLKKMFLNISKRFEDSLKELN